MFFKNTYCITGLLLSITLFTSCINKDHNITLAITNAMLITMNDEEVLENYTILISDNKIKRILPASQWKNNNTIKTIDATGKFVIPALTDMHVHHVPNNENILPMFLSYGVTTLRYMAGSENLLNFRDSIYQYQLNLPDIFIASQLIDGDPPVWGEQHNGPILTDVNNVENVIDSQIAMGYDFIKVYSSLSSEVFLEIVKIANKKGIRVTGHLPVSLENEDLFPESFEIQHLSGYARYSSINESFLNNPTFSFNDLTLDKEASKSYSKVLMKEAALLSESSRIWNCPTLILFYNKSNNELCESLKKFKDIEKLGGLINWWESSGCGADDKTVDLVEFQHKMVAELHQRGNLLLAGTDFPNPWIIPGLSLHQELERFVESGLSNYEALKTATVNPAEWLGLEGEKGKILPDMKADLIILNQNPLVNISNTQNIHSVIFKGKINE